MERQYYYVTQCSSSSSSSSSSSRLIGFRELQFLKCIMWTYWASQWDNVWFERLILL